LRWEAEVKLLLVEDDAKIAGAIKRGLEGEGFDVEVAADGNEGLWRATEHRYDLIVLDILLPGRNGYQVCAELRAAGDWTPILMLTAKDGDLDEAEGLDTGADDFMTKPFSFTVLVARIRALLRRPLGSQTAPVSVLEFLVRRAGHVHSKGDILAGVWSDDFEGDPNIVEVYIGRLRRKVDEPFGRGLIETVRGAGYRMVDP
jgi:two-component system OmpR family response regulator